MADLPFKQAVERFQQNEKRIAQFVNNTDGSGEFETEGGAKIPALPVLLPAVLDAAELSKQQADRSETAAKQAETARDAASTNADLYDDIASGLAATADGQQFQVKSADGLEAIRYRRDSASVATPLIGFKSSKGVDALIGPLRLKNQYPQPGFADGVAPTLRVGSASLVNIFNAYLAGKGAVKGVRIATGSGTSSATAQVRIPLPTGSAGRHVIMSCFGHTTDGHVLIEGRNQCAYLTTGTTLSYAGLSSRYVVVAPGIYLFQRWGQIPADATALAIGANLDTQSDARLVTGVTYAIADVPILPEGFEHERLTPPEVFQSKAQTEAQVQSLVSAAFAPEVRLVLNGTASNSFVEGRQGARTVRREFTPFPTASLLDSNVFNFRGDYIDGVLVKSASDDVAPYRALGTTIGANHGFFMGNAIAASHGKTSADVGAVYSNGGAEYVIVSIASADRLYLTPRVGNGSVPTGTFTRVSGGTSAGSFTVSSVTNSVNWFPPITSRRIRCFVDGKEIAATTGTFGFADRAVIVESYDVLDKTELVNWLIANGSTGALAPQGDPAFTVSISYEFDREANCTIYTDFLALKSIPLQDIMFLQAQRGELTHYYIPKALPFTHEGFSFDYAKIEAADKTVVNGLNTVNLSPDRCELEGILCDRVIGFNGSASAFAMGYLPVGTTGIAERRSQAANRAIEIRGNTGKLYPRAVDKGNVTLSPGEYFSTIGYRNVFARPTERTTAYPVRTRGDDFLYMDWHNVAKLDRVPLPVDFAGRSFEVVEKSANVTLMSQSLTNSVAVNVAAAGSYGYLILRVS